MNQPSVVALSIPLAKVAPEGYFQRPDASEPVFTMRLGDVEVALPFAGIRREFHVEPDCEDDRMLALIARALDFVSVVRIGDPLPSEILTGEPSWRITSDHRLRAYHRLTVQLAAWIKGEACTVANADELKRVAEDPENQETWSQAFDEAARRLGFAEDGRERIGALIQSLAEEVAYIEALREQNGRIRVALHKANAMRRIYAHRQKIRENADSVARLMGRAQALLQTRFDELDALTLDMIAALKGMARLILAIRKARDDLYCRLSAWADLLQRWDKLTAERNDTAVALLADSYRFLALRYMPAVEWLLMSRLGNFGDGKPKTAVVW